MAKKQKPNSALNKNIRTRLIITLPVLMVVFPILSGIFQYNQLINNFQSATNPFSPQEQSSAFMQLWLTTGSLILIAALCGFLLAFYITKPINKMIHTLKDIADGDFFQELDFHTKDEFSALGSTFNEMVKSLNRTIEERNKIILECYTGGLVTMDLLGRVTAINSSAEKILDLESFQIIGKKMRDILEIREAQNDLLDVLTKGANGEYVQSLETTISRIDGTAFPLLVSTSPLTGANQNQQGIILNFRDLTQYKIFYQRLSRTDRLATAGTLAMGVAHEIRNPLASIRGMAQLLQQDIAPDAPGRNYCDVIVDESRRLDSVVRELLDFTQPDEASCEPCNLSELMQRASEAMKMQMSQREDKIINIEENYAKLPEQKLYSHKMIQAFSNILTNAASMVPEENGKIEVRTFIQQTISDSGHPTRSICAEIANNGPEIPEEDRERIFEPFYTKRNGGSGLGLSITYQIISSNGGQIEVESQKGRTAFIVSFAA